MVDSDVESVCSSVSETGSPEASSSTIAYIGSQLPYFVTEKVIRNHFLQYGFGDCVTSVKLVYKDGRFMGWGCVHLKTAEDAQNAISKVNGTNLHVGKKYKHVLVVQHYEHKSRSASSHSPSAANEQPSSRSYHHGGRKRQSSSSSFQVSSAEMPIHKGGQESVSSGKAKKTHRESKKKSSASVSSTVQHVVQLKNCHVHISEDDIRDIVRVPVINCTCEPAESCSGDVRTVYITVNTLKDASKAIAATNSKIYFGYTISATVTPSVGEPSQGKEDLTSAHAKATVLYFSTSGVITKLGFEKYLSNRLPKSFLSLDSFLRMLRALTI